MLSLFLAQHLYIQTTQHTLHVTCHIQVSMTQLFQARVSSVFMQTHDWRGSAVQV